MNLKLMRIDPDRNLALYVSKLSLGCCSPEWSARAGRRERRPERLVTCFLPALPCVPKAGNVAVFSQACTGLTFLQSNKRETTDWKLEKNYWILFLDFPLFLSDFKGKYYFMFLLEFYLSINSYIKAVLYHKYVRDSVI